MTNKELLLIKLEACRRYLFLYDSSEFMHIDDIHNLSLLNEVHDGYVQEAMDFLTNKKSNVDKYVAINNISYLINAIKRYPEVYCLKFIFPFCKFCEKPCKDEEKKTCKKWIPSRGDKPLLPNPCELGSFEFIGKQHPDRICKFCDKMLKW